MKRLPGKVVAGLLTLLGLTVAVYFLSREEPPEVELYTVFQGSVSATVANTRAGTVKACRRSRLAPNAAGQVTRLMVREGDQVKAGDLLLEIWHQDLVAEQELAENEVVAAGNRANEICLRAEVAKREAKRIDDLKHKQFASVDQLDQSSTQAKAAAQGCLAAKVSVKTARSKLRVVKANIERNLLIAPFAGIVAEVNAELGEFITPSPTGIQTLPAVDLIDSSCLYVSAPIDEVDAPAVATGMKATIKLDAFPEQDFPAIVRRTAPYVLDLEKQARTVEVEAEFQLDEITVTLLPGYSADLEVLLQKREKVIVIPTESIRNEDSVLLYDPASGTLTQRTIKTGISNWELTEVLAGLQVGDRIMLNGANENFKDGSEIRPKPSAKQ